MVSKLIICVFAFMVANIHISKSSALRIEISPTTYTEDSVGPANITCITDIADQGDHDIYLMEIKRDGADPIVFLRATSGISYGADTFESSRMLVEGHIDKDVSKNFLTLSLTRPVNNDKGVYTCIMFLSDELGFLKERRASGPLVVEKFDVHGALKTILEKVTLLESKLDTQTEEVSRAVAKVEMLEEKWNVTTQEVKNNSSGEVDRLERDVQLQLSSALDGIARSEQQCNDRMAALEETIRDEYSTMQHRLGMVEDETKNQSHKMDLLNEKGTHVTVFSAGLDKDTIPIVGDAIVYPLMITEHGQGYNSTTGVFTAPRAGLYGFNLLITNKCHNCWTECYIQVNDVKNLARVSAASEQNWGDQGSYNGVSVLEKGDKVKVVVKAVSKTGDPKLWGWPVFNQFTGYLIRAL